MQFDLHDYIENAVAQTLTQALTESKHSMTLKEALSYLDTRNPELIPSYRKNRRLSLYTLLKKIVNKNTAPIKLHVYSKSNIVLAI